MSIQDEFGKYIQLAKAGAPLALVYYAAINDNVPSNRHIALLCSALKLSRKEAYAVIKDVETLTFHLMVERYRLFLGNGKSPETIFRIAQHGHLIYRSH